MLTYRKVHYNMFRESYQSNQQGLQCIFFLINKKIMTSVMPTSVHCDITLFTVKTNVLKFYYCLESQDNYKNKLTL